MSISNNANLLDPKDSSAQQLGFMNALNCDIVVEILSNLTQQECLTCMAVCRDWYYIIPHYTQTVWRELRLGVQDASTNYQRRQQCLGGHVKRVVLQSVEDEAEARPLATLMQRLLDWGCTEIESLEFLCCSSADQNAFVDLLRQLASRLKHLKLERHRSSMSILAVLSVCPELTHLTYHHTPPFSWGDVQPMIPPNIALSPKVPVDYFPKVTYLRLDVNMEKKELECILKACPELRCFVGVTCQTSRLNPRQPSGYDYVDTSSLLSWCPKINSIISNFNCYAFDDNEDPGSYTSNTPGLRYFHPSVLDNGDQIASYIASSRDTLEFLCILRPYHDGDWSSVFESLRMPKLRTLICNNTALPTASSLVPMLNSCSVLQKLDLHCPLLTLDMTLARSLGTMHLVHYLRITDVKLQDGPSMAAFLERFPALETLTMADVTLPLQLPEYFQCPRQLKSLSITDAKWGQNNNNRELSTYETVAHFLERLTCNTKLETLELLSIHKLRTNGLLTITKMATLKNLTVHLHYFLRPPGTESSRGRGRGRGRISPTLWSQYRRQRDAEFLEFVKLLHEARIEKLMFYDCYGIPSAVLHALAELPLLKEFRTGCFEDNEICTRMRGEDLVRMLYKSQSLVYLNFFNATIEGDGSTLGCEQLNALIQDQNSVHNTMHTKTRRWEASGYYNGVVIEGLSIKRLK